MRSICCTFLILSVAVVGLVGSAWAVDFGCRHTGTCGSGTWSPLCAPACAAPAYGLEQGCCESSPSCCDDAWAGYCQERARRQAFWDRCFAKMAQHAHHPTVVYERSAQPVECMPTRAIHGPVERSPAIATPPAEAPRPTPMNSTMHPTPRVTPDPTATPRPPITPQPPITPPPTESIQEPTPEPVVPGTTWRWRSFWQR